MSKKLMKKLLAVTVAAVMMVGTLAACGGSGGDTPAPDAGSSAGGEQVSGEV